MNVGDNRSKTTFKTIYTIILCISQHHLSNLPTLIIHREQEKWKDLGIQQLTKHQVVSDGFTLFGLGQLLQ